MGEKKVDLKKAGGRETTTFCDGDGFGIPSFKKVKFIKVIKKTNCLILKLKIVK